MHYFIVEIPYLYMCFIDDLGILSTKPSPTTAFQKITTLRFLIVFSRQIDLTNHNFKGTAVENN